jgi:KDO2-lipid IV(A) lauroyltransferase
MTGTAYGLAVFEMKMGAPVIPIWNWRDRESGKFHVCIEPPVICDFDGEHPKSLDKDTRILRMTENYNRILEEIIRKKPEQWMWIHRRWKKYE